MNGEVKQNLESADPRFMASLARGLDVLSSFEDHGTLTISQLTKLCGLSRSAVARCLFTLERLGYVSAEGTHYSLTPAVLPLARAFALASPLAKAGQVVVDALRDRLGESSSLAMFDPRRGHACVVYVHRAETARIISVPLFVGSALPSYCTSNGRVLLSMLGDDELAAYLARAPFAARTGKTLTGAAALAGEIAKVRDQGFALTDGELEAGLRSIAVPVPSRGQPAALNLATQSAHRSLGWLMDTALPELQAAAAHLTRIAGG